MVGAGKEMDTCLEVAQGARAKLMGKQSRM